MTTYNVLFFILGIGLAATSTILNGDYAFFDSLWPGVAGYVVATFSLIINQARAHAAKFQAGIKIDHTKAWVIRALVGVSIACLLHAYYWQPVKVVELAVFGMFYFGLLFDISLNHYRSLPTTYIHSGDGGSVVDRIFTSFKGGRDLLTLLEISGLVFFAYRYIKL